MESGVLLRTGWIGNKTVVEHALLFPNSLNTHRRRRMRQSGRERLTICQSGQTEVTHE